MNRDIRMVTDVRKRVDNLLRTNPGAYALLKLAETNSTVFVYVSSWKSGDFSAWEDCMTALARQLAKDNDRLTQLLPEAHVPIKQLAETLLGSIQEAGLALAVSESVAPPLDDEPE